MKKILINGLIISNKNAGIGNYGTNLINNMVKYNEHYNMSVITQKNIDFHGISNIKKDYSSNYKRIIGEQFLLHREFSKYDLVHFIDYSSPVIKMNKPYIVTIHDLSFYKYPQTFTYGSRKIKELIAPFSIKGATKIITDSESTKADILDMFKINERKVSVIYPGKPDYKSVESVEDIEAVKRKYGIMGDYILYLGTLEPRKNILRLIESYGELRKNGIKENLVIAGKKGWLYEDIFKRVIQLNLEKHVIFTDFIEESHKPALYSGAKVFVYPSLYEGFGLPPLEAMSCGVPVVVSNTSSMPEVVGSCGIYVNPKDVDSIGKGIYDVINNTELRDKLKIKGELRSREFQWEKATDKIIKIYNEILR